VPKQFFLKKKGAQHIKAAGHPISQPDLKISETRESNGEDGGLKLLVDFRQQRLGLGLGQAKLSGLRHGEQRVSSDIPLAIAIIGLVEMPGNCLSSTALACGSSKSSPRSGIECKRHRVPPLLI